MKTLLLFLAIFISVSSLSAQHYGGLYFSPTWTIQGDGTPFWNGLGNNLQTFDYTFGYTAGYQGLLMENRRFSFSYGLQYAYQFMESNYKPGGTGISFPSITYENVAGTRSEIHSLEIPLSWRYNILKNRKFQPYVSVATTSVFQLHTNMEITHLDGSQADAPWKGTMGYSLYFDLGVGVNYKVNDWIFNVQPTLRPWNSWGKLGVGFSVMKKF